jgi:hypothetical protein
MGTVGELEGSSSSAMRSGNAARKRGTSSQLAWSGGAAILAPIRVYGLFVVDPGS